jgi:DNA-binding NarL/FixJ family response regulator
MAGPVLIVDANTTRPAAALVDIGLPDRNGIDLAPQLAGLPWRPRVVLTSTDRDAVSAIGSDGRSPLPFVPKDELATAPLRRMLIPERGPRRARPAPERWQR